MFPFPCIHRKAHPLFLSVMSKTVKFVEQMPQGVVFEQPTRQIPVRRKRQ